MLDDISKDLVDFHRFEQKMKKRFELHWVISKSEFVLLLHANFPTCYELYLQWIELGEVASVLPPPPKLPIKIHQPSSSMLSRSTLNHPLIDPYMSVVLELHKRAKDNEEVEERIGKHNDRMTIKARQAVKVKVLEVENLRLQREVNKGKLERCVFGNV
uniref:Uncharacterized protein n=1 Tax=Nelumbo nucifera TaxID=4432 RepID=A0A822YDC3_NELNU|nr:TPA_asm: hypothetical protein HUJ06_030757 [Nelumbo nucifera]